MADARAELEELRRLDELERRAAPVAAPAPAAPANKKFKRLFGQEVELTPEQQQQTKDITARGWGTGVPKFAYDLGGTVTDKTGSPALGYLANVATEAIPALASSFSIQGAPSVLQRPAEALMKKAIKPSTTEDPAKIAKALRTALDEGLNPSYGSVEKASKISRGLNPEIDAAIGASNARIPLADIEAYAQGPMATARNQVAPQADMAAVQKTLDEFKAHPDFPNMNLAQVLTGEAPSIPVQLAHSLKKGTYKSLGEKAYGELGSASTETQKQLARGMREQVMQKVPEVEAPLARQADLANWREIVGNAAAREGNKDLLGISVAAGSPQTMVASMLDRLGIAKSLAARTMYTAGKPAVANPLVIGGSEYQQTEKDRMAEYLRKRAQ